MSVPLEDQIAELRREIRFRERIFPRWVQDGKIEEAEAARRMVRIRAALASLYELSALKNPTLFDQP